MPCFSLQVLRFLSSALSRNSRNPLIRFIGFKDDVMDNETCYTYSIKLNNR